MQEIRRTDESFEACVASFAALLDEHGVAHVTYAAEMSAHKILALDARLLHGRCVGLGPQGIGPMTAVGLDLEAATRAGAQVVSGEAASLPEAVGLADDYTYWTIDSWRSGAGWLARGSFHEPGYLASPGHFLEGWKPVDAVAIAEFLNRVELAREGCPEAFGFGISEAEIFARMRAMVEDVSTDFGPRARS